MAEMTENRAEFADVRDRFIAQIVRGRTFVDVGGLYEIVKERVSVAHAHGAAEVALMDIDQSSDKWDAMRKRLAALGVAKCRFICGDVQQMHNERFDVVYSSGILYHVASPLHYLEALRRMAREHVIIASTVLPERIAGPTDIVHPPGSVLYLPGVPVQQRPEVAAFFAKNGRPDIFADAANPLRDVSGVYWLPTRDALVAMCRDIGFDVLDHRAIENDALLGYALLLRVPQPVEAPRVVDSPQGSAAPAVDPAQAGTEAIEHWHRRVRDVMTETGEINNPWMEPHLRRYAFSMAELAKLNGDRDVAFETGLTKLFPFLLTCDLGYRRVFGTCFETAKRVDNRAHHSKISIFGTRVRTTAFNIDLEHDSIPLADASVDLVLCCEVIEHMDIDPMFMLAEINRITKPGGHLFLTTPNITSTRAVWKILNGYAPHFYMQYTKDRSPHRHNYEHDVHSLQALTRAAGFDTRVLKTIDVFEQSEPQVLLALSQLGMTTEFRGDDIFFIGQKIGPVADRWPIPVYV